MTFWEIALAVAVGIGIVYAVCVVGAVLIVLAQWFWERVLRSSDG